MHKHKFVTIMSFLLFLVVSILIGVSIITSGASGANQTFTATRLNIWNTEPTLYSVTISPTNIDLTPGNSTRVNCTGEAWDYNGWQDINVTNVTFFHSTVLGFDDDDNNNHYTLNSSQLLTECVCSSLSSTNASCVCGFDIWYYATNGSWMCNMTIVDNGGNATEGEVRFNSTLNSTYATINQIVGVGAPDEINYGNLSVTEISNETGANISNYGNVPINISIRGYGGTDPSKQYNFSTMNCDYGNITLGYQRVTGENGTPFSDMENVTNISTSLPNFDLPVRTNDTALGRDTNQTYWRLEIPLSVAGPCNGTIEFSAQLT